MNEQELISKAMSILGKRTSDRKRESSRANAKRPRKKKHSKRIASAMPNSENQQK